MYNFFNVAPLTHSVIFLQTFPMSTAEGDWQGVIHCLLGTFPISAIPFLWQR